MTINEIHSFGDIIEYLERFNEEDKYFIAYSLSKWDLDMEDIDFVDGEENGDWYLVSHESGSMLEHCDGDDCVHIDVEYMPAAFYDNVVRYFDCIEPLEINIDDDHCASDACLAAVLVDDRIDEGIFIITPEEKEYSMYDNLLGNKYSGYNIAVVKDLCCFYNDLMYYKECEEAQLLN